MLWSFSCRDPPNTSWYKIRIIISILTANYDMDLDTRPWYEVYEVEVDCWYRALESRTLDIGRVLAGPGSEAQSHVKGNFNSQYSLGSVAASSGSVHWVLQHQQVTCKLQLPGDSGDTLTCREGESYVLPELPVWWGSLIVHTSRGRTQRPGAARGGGTVSSL